MVKKRKVSAGKVRPANASASKKRAAAKAAKSVAKKKVAAKKVANKKTTVKPAAKQSESLAHKVAGAFRAVLDTLTDAERLHHRLEPDPTRDPDPE